MGIKSRYTWPAVGGIALLSLVLLGNVIAKNVGINLLYATSLVTTIDVDALAANSACDGVQVSSKKANCLAVRAAIRQLQDQPEYQQRTAMFSYAARDLKANPFLFLLTPYWETKSQMAALSAHRKAQLNVLNNAAPLDASDPQRHSSDAMATYYQQVITTVDAVSVAVTVVLLLLYVTILTRRVRALIRYTGYVKQFGLPLPDHYPPKRKAFSSGWKGYLSYLSACRASRLIASTLDQVETNNVTETTLPFPFSVMEKLVSLTRFIFEDYFKEHFFKGTSPASVATLSAWEQRRLFLQNRHVTLSALVFPVLISAVGLSILMLGVELFSSSISLSLT